MAEKNAREPAKHTSIAWDWKDHPSKEELRAALKPFGVFVEDHPGCEGTDTIGYVFSDRKLTKAELAEIAEEE
jgi:hypothetical protein